MENVLVIAILLIILGLAVGYILRAKKNGKKCIGCPASSTCGRKCCSCSEENENN